MQAELSTEKRADELACLRAELAELVAWRANELLTAQAMIDNANRHFDDKAFELHRAIKKLEPPPEPTTPTVVTRKPRAVKFSLAGMEDWTPEDIANYKRLKGVA